MKVGVIAEQLREAIPGGIGTYVTGLLTGLGELGDPEVEIVALASRGAQPDPLRSLTASVQTSALPHRALVALWDRGLSQPRGSFDVVHLTSFAGPLRRTARQPITLMIHDLAWRLHPELTTTRGARWHEAAYLRARCSSAKLIVPSPEVAELLAADGVAGDRVTVIAEGSDHLPPADHEAAQRVLAAHHIGGEFLLTVSTLEPRKNLSRLLDAHRASGGGLPPLVVVGPEGWGPSVQPAPGVALVGRQPGEVLAALYERCMAFAYVPVVEGFGLPPLEAMAHGAPVIVSDSTPSTRAAAPVWKVDPLDTDAILDALSGVVGDPGIRGEAGVRGRAFAAQRRWVDAARAHVELWRSIS